MSNIKKIITFIMVILIIVLVILISYSYYTSHSSDSSKTNRISSDKSLEELFSNVTDNLIDSNSIDNDTNMPSPNYDTITEDLSNSDKPEVLSVSLNGYGLNDDPDAYIDNMYKIDVISTGVTGLFGCPVEINFSISEADLVFEVDPDTNMDILKNLIVLYYDLDKMFYSEIDWERENNIITSTIDESGTYLLVDKYIWYSAWGEDMSDYAHNTYFYCDEFEFEFLLAFELATNIVSDYWHAESYYINETYYEIMEKTLLYQNSSDDKVDIDLTAHRYPNEEDDCEAPAPLISLDEYTNNVLNNLNTTGDNKKIIEPKEVIELSNGRKGYIITSIYPYNAEEGISEQTNITGYYEYSDDTYIQLNYWINSIDTDMIQEAKNSLRTFKYKN